MSAVLRDPVTYCLSSIFADPNVSPIFKHALRPVLTVADEPLIRFRIFDMWDDTETVPLFDDFEVDRKAAASILRKHRRDGSYIERRGGQFYIEPRQA